MTTAFEMLWEGIYVCRSETHGFGTDAFLLTAFANCRSHDRVCDLGTGCGIIPLLMHRDCTPEVVYALDIQPKAIAQLNEGIKKSAAELHIEPVCADLCDLWEDAPLGMLDLVTCNPPYKASDTGILSQDAAKQIARHETRCSFDDICTAAEKLLRWHGRFCICCRPERLTDAMCAMRAHKLEPKRLRLVCKSPESAPWLFLLEGVRGGRPFLRIEPTLFMRSGSGMTDEAARLCHFGKGIQ